MTIFCWQRLSWAVSGVVKQWCYYFGFIWPVAAKSSKRDYNGTLIKTISRFQSNIFYPTFLLSCPSYHFTWQLCLQRVWLLSLVYCCQTASKVTFWLLLFNIFPIIILQLNSETNLDFTELWKSIHPRFSILFFNFFSHLNLSGHKINISVRKYNKLLFSSDYFFYKVKKASKPT